LRASIIEREKWRRGRMDWKGWRVKNMRIGWVWRKDAWYWSVRRRNDRGMEGDDGVEERVDKRGEERRCG